MTLPEPAQTAAGRHKQHQIMLTAQSEPTTEHHTCELSSTQPELASTKCIMQNSNAKRPPMLMFLKGPGRFSGRPALYQKISGFTICRVRQAQYKHV